MPGVLFLTHTDARDPGVFLERARDRGVPADLWCPGLGDPAPADPAGYDALVVMGGGMNVQDAPGLPYLRDELALAAAALEREQPLLGVCLGAQIVAAAAGGEVIRSPRPEVGWYEVETTGAAAEDPVFGDLPRRFTAYQWHSFAVRPPAGAVELARSPVCTQAYRVGRSAWGMQFHAEVTEAVLGEWIPAYPTDPDAARVGGDPAAALAEVPARLPAWNAVGRALFDAFLDTAGARVGAAR